MKKTNKKIIKRLIQGIVLLFILSVATIGLLAAKASRYNGMWRMEAYGFCFDIHFGRFKAYEVTDHFYTRINRYDGIIVNGNLYCGLGKFKLKKDNNQLSLIDKGSQTVYNADKVEDIFLDNKKNVEEGNAKDKLGMFYEVFKENYAFFDMYQVDIDSEYEKYKSLVTETTDDETLFKYMCEMVSGLKDGHVELYLKDKEYMPHSYKPEWITDKEKQKFVSDTLKQNYIKDYYKFEDSYIRYGSLREDIGYIIIQALGMEELNKSASTKKAMDKIIEEFQDKKTIIIDLRFCSGGFDEASLLIAGYFTKEPYLAYKKQAYFKGDLTKLQDIYVYPNKLTYTGDIVIMLSEYTISAGESFAKAMLANPNHKIKTIGKESAGFYSDSIHKILPGGFDFCMSTERYYSSDDSLLEGNGVIPDVYMPVSFEDAQNGVDRAFEWVLENY